MKCRICGCDCPPGAKICRDCAAARKRAFAQTVTQPLLAAVGAPSVGEPRFAPRPARRPAANDTAVARETARAEPAALPLTAVPRQLGMLWLLVVVVIIGMLVLVWLRARSEDHGGEEPARLETAPPVAKVAPPAVAPEQKRPEEPAIESPPVKLPVLKPAKKAAPRPEPPPAVAPPAPAPEPAPVVRSAPPPPRLVETPRPDPWQALNEGLARCAREALFDRIACEQRLRVQYCGSSWGVVPQCPIGPATDHGQ